MINLIIIFIEKKMDSIEKYEEGKKNPIILS